MSEPTFQFRGEQLFVHFNADQSAGFDKPTSYVFLCAGIVCEGAKKGHHGRGEAHSTDGWIPCPVCDIAIRPDEAA